MEKLTEINEIEEKRIENLAEINEIDRQLVRLANQRISTENIYNNIEDKDIINKRVLNFYS